MRFGLWIVPAAAVKPDCLSTHTSAFNEEGVLLLSTGDRQSQAPDQRNIEILT